jgi:hypothetical protein|tara:strand:+ start:775 stop:1722 length:948 start_codon:yes stop_codon:yes gene_type:complete
MGIKIFRKARKSIKKAKHSVSKKIEHTGKAIGKETEKVVKTIRKHPIKALTAVGEVGEFVGGGLEIAGALTGQPEIIAAGMGVQALGAGISSVAALSKGDIGGAISKGKKAVSKGKETDLTTGQTEFSEDQTGTGTKLTKQLIKKIGKQNKKQNKMQQKELKLDERANTLALHELHDINRVNDSIVGLRTDLAHQQKINNRMNGKMTGLISHMDHEEETIANELGAVSDGLGALETGQGQILNATQNQNVLVDNTNELLEEESRVYTTTDDFRNQINQLDNFNETIQFLVRKQSQFNLLPATEQAKLIRMITLRF